MKNKIVKYGWVGKKIDLKDAIKAFNENFFYFNIDVFAKKGNRCDWINNSWPPQKVKITIEYVENEKRGVSNG